MLSQHTTLSTSPSLEVFLNDLHLQFSCLKVPTLANQNPIKKFVSYDYNHLAYCALAMILSCESLPKTYFELLQ